MPVVTLPITPTDLDAAGWSAALDEAGRPTITAYASEFNRLSGVCAAEGRAREGAVLALLGAVCNFALVPNREDGPYAPVFSGGGQRSPLPEDLSDNELDILEHILSNSDDDELRACMADILWVRRRQHRFAKQAVESYVKSAEHLERSGEYAYVAAGLERANQLAPLFGGPPGNLLQEVLASVAQIVRARLQNNVTERTLRLLDLLHNRRYGEPREWAQVARSLAEHLESKNEFHAARGFWVRAARAHGRAGDKESQKTALIRAAETHVKLANEHPNETGKASLIRKAFEAYRQIPGTEDRQHELHGLLLCHQEQSVNEMMIVSTPIDFGEYPEQARAQVKGKDLCQALNSLSLLMDPINPDKLRERTIERAHQTPLLFLLQSEQVNALGRVIGVKPLATHDEEGAICATMFSDANLERVCCVKGLIVPALEQIGVEHPDAVRQDLEPLVRHNAFIPPDREIQFAKGLLAGIRWDFIGASHLLIPQVENSLRAILRRLGVITTGLANASRRQSEQSLNTTLTSYQEQLIQVLGDDVVFELRSLLIEPLGANLRNEVMHGLMSDGAFSVLPQYTIGGSYFVYAALAIWVRYQRASVERQMRI